MLLALHALWNKQANCSTHSLLKITHDCGCSIVECRSVRLADRQGLMALVEGHWNQIARLEGLVESLNHQDDVSVFAVRSAPESKIADRIPYTVDVYGSDRKEILSAVTEFFDQHDIHIEDMSSSSFSLMDHSGQILNAHFLVLVPGDQSLLGLRDEFLSYCDQLKVDALMEPAKR